jgi:hypothetical protein
VGDNFIDGWNQVRFFIENRTTTGSPVVTNITSWELYVTTASGTSQTVIVDRMTLQKSAMHYLEYYSNRMFIDGTTRAWKEEPEAVTDYINLNRDALGVLHYEACRLVVQSATFDKVDSQESKRFDNELARKLDQYFARHPSSEMPLSYNISPNVAVEVPLEITLVPEEPLVVESTSAGIVFISNETPSGVVNSVNTVYALIHSPSPTDSLMLYLNGQLQIQGVDYTLVGSAITFTIAPTIGSYITAFYRYIS